MTSPVGRPLWTGERTLLALAVLHVPIIAVGPVVIVSGLAARDIEPTAVNVVGALVLGAVALVLQVRHSIAAAHGARPRWWPVTFAALVAVAAVPMPWFGARWEYAWVPVVASALMLLPRAVSVSAWVLLLLADAFVIVGPGYLGEGVVVVAASIAYDVLLISAGIAALFGSTQLVRALRELQDTRAELAGMSVTAERLRIARDLHDLLGQSLSAVSLKGDLASALLTRDPVAARAEIESLTETARAALRDVRTVASAPDRPVLGHEIEGARTLLRAAGVDAVIEVDLDAVDAAGAELFGWVVREGVTNVVRHSEAEHVSIRVGRGDDGRVELRIVNDGARPAEGAGTGLDGVRARARALSGNVVARRGDDDSFVLAVDVPARAPEEAT